MIFHVWKSVHETLVVQSVFSLSLRNLVVDSAACLIGRLVSSSKSLFESPVNWRCKGATDLTWIARAPHPRYHDL